MVGDLRSETDQNVLSTNDQLKQVRTEVQCKPFSNLKKIRKNI
jgi:hypothetical protein